MDEEKHILIKENEELRIENNKLKDEIRKLEEKSNAFEKEVRHQIDKMTCECDQKLYKVMDEQEKRHHEMKESGKMLIKAIAKFI